jgi:DNA polymerase-3 subunit delta
MLTCVMAARRISAPKLGDVLLVTGPEAFLADRAVRSAIDTVAKGAPEVEVTDMQAADVDAGLFSELTGPSLFAAERMLVLRGLEGANAEVGPRLVAYAKEPAADVAVVLVHSGGQKGKALLDQLRKAGVNEFVAAAPKPWELPQFAAAELRGQGGTIDEGAAAALVDAVGHDLRALAGACSQLVSDAGGERITAELINRYFGGRAEVTSFAVADAAIAGRTEPALEQLRWALDCGVAPVLVTSAMAGGLRGLAKYTSAPSDLREADLARAVGVPPWKLKSLRQQSRGWSSGGLATAIKAVAQADADVKGASGDSGYALERMVIAVCRARDRR